MVLTTLVLYETNSKAINGYIYIYIYTHTHIHTYIYIESQNSKKVQLNFNWIQIRVQFCDICPSNFLNFVISELFGEKPKSLNSIKF